MKKFLIGLLLFTMTGPVMAQGSKNKAVEAAPTNQGDTQKQQSSSESDYKNSLGRYPDKNTGPRDPWGSVRDDDKPKSKKASQ